MRSSWLPKVYENICRNVMLPQNGKWNNTQVELVGVTAPRLFPRPRRPRYQYPLPRLLPRLARRVFIFADSALSGGRSFSSPMIPLPLSPGLFSDPSFASLVLPILTRRDLVLMLRKDDWFLRPRTTSVGGEGITVGLRLLGPSLVFVETGCKVVEIWRSSLSLGICERVLRLTFIGGAEA